MHLVCTRVTLSLPHQVHPLREHPPVDVGVPDRVVAVSDPLGVELVQGLRHVPRRAALRGVHRAADAQLPGTGEHLLLHRVQDGGWREREREEEEEERKRG